MAASTYKYPVNIAVIGECMIELCGQPLMPQQQNFGGDTLNTALYLSRLLPELSPSYITAVGKDNYSNAMVEAWQQEGINCHFVWRDPRKLPGMYSIEIDPYGERSFHYWRNDSAARQWCDSPLFDMVVDYLKTVDLLYLSGISLAILPEHSKVKLLAALKSIRQAGVKIAIDSNYRPRLWDSQLSAKTWMMKLYSIAHIALVTGEDEDLLHGTINSSPALIAKRLHQQGVQQIAVKMGKEGVVWFDNEKSGTVPAMQIANVIDTTAAGDAFNAGYLAGWARGFPMAQCCFWGNQVAAEVIQHHGAVISPHCTDALTKQMEMTA